MAISPTPTDDPGTLATRIAIMADRLRAHFGVEFVRQKALVRYLGLSAMTAYRLERAGRFVKRFSGLNDARYAIDDIAAYLIAGSGPIPAPPAQPTTPTAPRKRGRPLKTRTAKAVAA